MRKYFKLLMLSALILGVSACTNEGMEPELDSATTAMSFTFRTGNNPLVTRVIGDEAAGEFDLNSVDIYAFDSNSGDLVGKLVPGTDITTTTGSGTINYAATPAWLRANSGRTLNFYFVANDATSTNGAHMPAVTPATESAFVELITNQLTDSDTDGYYDNIATPLLFSTSAKNVQLVGKIQKDILLYRRVARFDIVNDHYATFQVNKIMVSNAATKGYIFGDATGVNNPLPQGSLEEITGPAQSAYAVVDGEYLAPHVFYLYPTTVGLMEDDAANTEIVINATIGGQTKNYIVPTEIDILANKRYKLVLDPVSLTFSIVAADWDEGERLPVDLVDDDSIVLSDFLSAGDGTWTEGNMNYEFTATVGNTFTFNATTKYGTETSIEYIAGGTLSTDIVVTKTGSVTSHNPHLQIVDTYQVTVPADDKDLHFIALHVKTQQGNGEATISFTKHAGGEADLVYFDSGTIQVGKWGTDVTSVDNIAFFKFGSVIGINSALPQFDPGTSVLFNPSNITLTTFGSIPYFASSDYSAGIRNISDAAYHNATNILSGKGDPCRLVGFVIGTDDPAIYDSGWRLPTQKENAYFVGGPKMTSESSVIYTYLQNTATANAETANYWLPNDGSSKTNPSVTVLPVVQGENVNPVGMILPAAGSQNTTSGAWSGGTAYYWSSSVLNSMGASHLNSGSVEIRSGALIRPNAGIPVRCVRNY